MGCIPLYSHAVKAGLWVTIQSKHSAYWSDHPLPYKSNLSLEKLKNNLSGEEGACSSACIVNPNLKPVHESVAQPFY